MKRVVVSCLIAASMVWGRIGLGAVDEGSVSKIPWSGSYWPKFQGKLITGPLTKYDQATGKRAAQVEYAASPPGPNVPKWHGYCHAWSCAAIINDEPTQPRTATGPRQQVQLTVGDQKGLLTASHDADLANTVGDRFGDGQGSEDPQDLSPDMVWQTLRKFIKQQRMPIVMDLEAGEEVWNYPVYAYRVEYAPAGAGGECVGQLSLWAADDAVPEDHVGVKVLYHTYTFMVRMNGDNIVMGSGRWTGNSVRNHPDFAWSPYVVRPSNQELDYAMVKQLVYGDSEGGSTPPPENPPPENPPPATPPGTSPPGTLPPGTTLPGNLVPPPGPFPPGYQPPPIVDPAGGNGIVGAPVSPAQLLALIAQKASSFDFDVSVDRFDGGQYGIGEQFMVRGWSGRGGYLYLFYFNHVGDLWLIYPLPGQNNLIPARQEFQLPGPTDPYVFQTTEPAGVARIKAVVTTWPLQLSGLDMQGQFPPQGKGLRHVSRRQFRWFPSEQAQIKDLLVQYGQKQKLTSKDLGGVDPLRLLGPFAQDEVAIYVKPRGR